MYGNKIKVGAVILLLLLVVQGVINQWVVKREHLVIDNINSIYNKELELNGARYYHRGWMQELENAFVTGYAPEIINHTDDQLGRWLADLEKGETKQQEIQGLEQIHEKIHSEAREVINLLNKGDREGAIDIFAGQVIPHSRQMEEVMFDLNDMYSSRISDSRDYLDSIHIAEQIIMLFFTLILLGGTIYYFYKQYLSIQKLVVILEEKNQELINQKNYAEAVLGSAAEGIFSINEDNIIRTWSRGAEEITGYSAGQVIGQKCCNFLWPRDEKGSNLCHYPEEADSEGCCYFKQITAKKDIIHGQEVYFQMENGECIPCQISIARIYDQENKPAGSVQVFRDISEEKANLLKIKKANRAKSEFLATMSHELRTPLNSVLGFGDLLQNEVAGKLNEKQLRYIENIIKSGNNLLSLINDILDLTRIESDEVDWDVTAFNLELLLKNSLVLVKGKAQMAGITLESDISGNGMTRIEWDESKIKMIINNLLSNAIKFTPEGGHVGLQACRQEGKIIIEVWDTGIGIPRDKQEDIFKPFVQLDSSLSRRYEGTGLGLDLVKKLIDICGGEIKVESEVGKGSRFIVKIPDRLDPEISLSERRRRNGV